MSAVVTADPCGAGNLRCDHCVEPGMDTEWVRDLLRTMGMLEHAGMSSAGRCFPDRRPHRPAHLTIPAIERVCEDFGVRVTERVPNECPEGHLSGPNRVIVGWNPCDCPTATSSAGAHGHRTYQCRTCNSIIEVPAHTGPPRPGVRWS